MNKKSQMKMHVISKESQTESIRHLMTSINGQGSWGSGSGNCFFNCMEYVGKKFNFFNASENYESNFTETSFWEKGSTVENGRPMDFKEVDGKKIPNPDTFDYLNMYFETKDTAWEDDYGAIDDYITKNRGENKGYVFAVIDYDSEQSHAVILNTDEGNYYTYIDPTSGERDVRIPKSQVHYATKIMGLKKDEEE